MKKTIFVLCVLAAMVSAVSAAEVPGNYYSWHQYPAAIYSCSAVPCAAGQNCSVDQGLCPAGTPNKTIVDLIGYKDINNPHDPRVVCHLDASAACPAPASLYLPRINVSNSGQIGLPLDVSKIQRFRLFVPPGTLYLSLTMFVQRDAHIAVAVRFNQPPTAPQMTNYSTFPFNAENQYNDMVNNLSGLAYLNHQDVYLQNAGGHIQIFAGGPGNFDNSNGGWLYVYTFYPVDNPYVAQVEYSVQVDPAVYTPWYDAMTANSGWASNGDPAIDGEVVVPPQTDPCQTDPTAAACQKDPFSCKLNFPNYNFCNGVCQAQACTPAQDPKIYSQSDLDAAVAKAIQAQQAADDALLQDDILTIPRVTFDNQTWKVKLQLVPESSYPSGFGFQFIDATPVQ